MSEKHKAPEKPHEKPHTEPAEKPKPKPWDPLPEEDEPVKPVRKPGKAPTPIKVPEHATLTAIPVEVERAGKFGVTAEHLEEVIGHDASTPEFDDVIAAYADEHDLDVEEDENGTIWFAKAKK